MRRIILNLHLYSALVAGLFVVILGITGSIIVFEPELDALTHPALFNVQPTGKPLPVQNVVDAIRRAFPHERSFTLALPAGPDRSYMVRMPGKEVFLNGYTAGVIGSRTTPTLLSDIHQIHLRLLMPKPIGGSIVSIASALLVWLVISGVYLWWPLKRLKVKTRASMRRIAFDLHSVVGIYSAIFLLVLAVTGICVHFDQDIATHLNKAAHVKMPVFMLPSPPEKGVKPITADQAIAAAQAAVPGTTPSYLTIPPGPKGSYRVMMHFPEDLTGTRSWAVVDQYNGKVLFAESSRTAPPGNKATTLNRAIHTGQIYGYPTKFLMCLSSLMLVVQVITGYILWWKKLRAGNSRRGVAERLSETSV